MDWGSVPAWGSVVVALISAAIAYQSRRSARDAKQSAIDAKELASRSAVAAERSATAAEESAGSASQSLVISKETLEHQKAVSWYIDSTSRNYYKKLSNVGGSTARDVRIQGEAIGSPDPSGAVVIGAIEIDEVPRGADVTFFVNPPTDGASFATILEVSWREDSAPDRRVDRFPIDRILM